MDNSLVVNIEHHRSRERVKDLGEVFTPEKYVLQMLDLIDSTHWSDENVIFFEPTCGHGSIVTPLLSKRIFELTNKFKRFGNDYPVASAIANAVNTLWAIDICPANIELTKKRAFLLVANLIAADSSELPREKLINFISHIICTLNWQIQHNEALTSLCKSENVNFHGSKTRSSSEWLRKNGHKQINFQNGWVNNYRALKGSKAEPIQFQRAVRFVSAAMNGVVKGFDEFEYAKDAIKVIAGENRISSHVRRKA